MVQRQNTHHCIELLRQVVRCDADPALDPAQPLVSDSEGEAQKYVSTAWGNGRMCKDYDKLFAWAEENRADNSTGVDVDYSLGMV